MTTEVEAPNGRILQVLTFDMFDPETIPRYDDRASGKTRKEQLTQRLLRALQDDTYILDTGSTSLYETHVFVLRDDGEVQTQIVMPDYKVGDPLGASVNHWRLVDEIRSGEFTNKRRLDK
jgi:hypothetical protein